MPCSVLLPQDAPFEMHNPALALVQLLAVREYSACQHTEISARLSQHRGVSHCASTPFTPYFTLSWGTKYNFFPSLKRIIFSCESPNIPWTPVLFSHHSWLMDAHLIQLSSHFQFVFSFKDSYLHFTAEVSAFIDLSYTSSPNKTVLTLPINVVQIIKTVISCISQTH